MLSVHHVCAVSKDARRGRWMKLTGVTMWLLGMEPWSSVRAKMLLTMVPSLQPLILSILSHHLTQEMRPGWKNTGLLREKAKSFPDFARGWEKEMRQA